MKKTFVCKDAYNDMASGVIDALDKYAILPDDLEALIRGGNFTGKLKITFEYEVEDPKPKLGDNYRIVSGAEDASINLQHVFSKTPCRNGVFVGGTHECPRVAFFVFSKEITPYEPYQISQTGPSGLVWDPSQPRAAAKVGQKIRAIKVVSEGQWVLVEGRIFEGRKIIVDRTDNTKLATVGQVFDCEGLPMVAMPE